MLTVPIFCLATNNVVINEIAWMGTNISANDEWIELYNNVNSDIDLNNWKLIAQDKTPKIDLKGKIPAKGFFLLERTDNTTVPNISANIIYTGALNNNGEYLQLINNKGEVIDEINCLDAWLAGDNKTKQTMEKIGDNWQTSKNSGGTPNVLNSPGALPIPAPEVKESITPGKVSDVKKIAEIAEKEIPPLLKKGKVEELPQFSNDFFSILLTGLPISLGSSALILLLKRKVKTKTKF